MAYMCKLVYKKHKSNRELTLKTVPGDPQCSSCLFKN